jgi:hypothetical protein
MIDANYLQVHQQVYPSLVYNDGMNRVNDQRISLYLLVQRPHDNE